MARPTACMAWRRTRRAGSAVPTWPDRLGDKVLGLWWTLCVWVLEKWNGVQVRLHICTGASLSALPRIWPARIGAVPQVRQRHTRAHAAVRLVGAESTHGHPSVRSGSIGR